MNSAVTYAFTLGLVGLLNPCGFPLLPAYLAFFVGDERRAWAPRLGRGLTAGGCLTLGFLIVFGALGLAATAALSVVAAVVPWVMVAAGLAMVVFGVLAAAGRTPRLRVPALRFASGAGAPAMIGFGAAYALGSLSCSLPLFVAGVSGALAGGSAAAGFGAFLAYAVGMGLFATGASVVAALVGAGAVRALRGAARVLPRAAGALCAIVGVYLTLYWVRELAAPGVRLPVIAGAQAAQASVASWLSQAALPVAAALGAIVVAGFVALALVAQKSQHAHREASR
ncbi:cytochrome c biogenesis CcdA family protein [Gryllotalpicola reticulitermitis]|uniref:Cytochrome c biogenesis CcdA family protein n=1 Tax=Gryllotalpicola reticulitermitis TaxID=1184153 RepID=A0ABV8Q7S2_9MICO